MCVTKLILSMTYRSILPASQDLAVGTLEKANKNPEWLQAWADSQDFLLSCHLLKEKALK